MSAISVSSQSATLNESLILDYKQVASSHQSTVDIWRVIHIVVVVAAIAFAILLGTCLALQFVATDSILQAFYVLGGLSAMTVLFHFCIKKATQEEIAQAQFFSRVEAKLVEMQPAISRKQIEHFFEKHQIAPTKDWQAIKLLKEHKFANGGVYTAFLPGMAHFKILTAEIPPLQHGPEFAVANAKRALQKFNAALILETLYRPLHHPKLKTNCLVEEVEGIGHFDLLRVIAGESEEAFVFNEQEKKAITITEFQLLPPGEIRALIFDKPTP